MKRNNFATLCVSLLLSISSYKLLIIKRLLLNMFKALPICLLGIVEVVLH